MKPDDYKVKIGTLIQENRLRHGYTQAQLAKELGTSQSAVNRIEKGGQNLSLEMIARISEILSHDIMTLNQPGKSNFSIYGGNELSGEIDVKTSKNGSVAILCAVMLNKGKTTLRHVARIEEINRIIEVLQSIGFKIHWINNTNDLEIIPPAQLQLDKMDVEAAKRTRTIIMFLGPLLHQYKKFQLPFSGGCSLGKRSVEPHLNSLQAFGLAVKATENYYEATVTPKRIEQPIVLIERGETVSENVIMAAVLYEGTTTIRNASFNYMVQDLCFFLQKLGIQIDGIGTSTLIIQGVKQINKDVEYFPSEDPIEAMSFIAAGVVTNSEITIRRSPIEFLEIELGVLAAMGLRYELSKEYFARNDKTRLVDITVKKSELIAAKDKLHALPFPGVNMDNLPFMGLIATAAHGRTLLHDWSYENRAIYFTELSKLNAKIELIDMHRVWIDGPTRWKPADVIAPPALRPSVVILLAMLAAPGHSILRDVYSISRGYEDLANRLNSIGARIEIIREHSTS